MMTKQGGATLVATMVKKYGSYEAYKQSMRELGSRGGKIGNTGGFASNVIGNDGLTGYERARVAGRKSGEISRKGLKFIKEDNGVRTYIARDTGKVVEYIYDSNSKEYKRKN